MTGTSGPQLASLSFSPRKTRRLHARALLAAPEGASRVRVKVMDILPWIPVTQPREVELPVVDGVVQCDVEQDVLYIAQVERYGKNGNVGHAFMGGFHLKSGAVASSVGHDNHNIIVMGTNFEDMAFAVNHLVKIQGGQCLVENGQVVREAAYPICGLLSDLSCEELAAQKDVLNAALAERGRIIPITFMFLSFICLAAARRWACRLVPLRLVVPLTCGLSTPNGRIPTSPALASLTRRRTA